MKSEIVLPSRVPAIEPAVEFVRSWGLKAGLTPEKADELALCADEVITDVVRFAFPPNEEHFFVVSVEIRPSEIELVLRELGEPFDPDAHPYNRERALEEGKFEGAGIEVVKHLSDHFLFLNKGRAGKEFRIVKRVPAKHITELLPESRLTEEPTATENYVLKPVSPEDAEDISRLIYRTYRYTYPKEDLYYPERVRAYIERGEKFGVIVRTEEGEPVGYFAVIVKSDSPIGEVGEAVVSPAHRGKGIMKRMMASLIEMAKERGLLGLYGEAITVHTISQRVNAKFGFSSTALLLGTFPSARIVGIESNYGQRISVVIDFLHLIERKKEVFYAPVRYRKILKDIYRGLGVEAKAGRGRVGELPSVSKLSLNVNSSLGTAEIVVKKAGKDLIDRIVKKRNRLFEKGIEVVYVDFPLFRPETKEIPDLKPYGFVFAGLMPLFHDSKDYLRFQSVKGSYDMSKVKVYSDLSKKIKRIVGRELREVGKRKG